MAKSVKRQQWTSIIKYEDFLHPKIVRDVSYQHLTWAIIAEFSIICYIAIYIQCFIITNIPVLCSGIQYIQFSLSLFRLDLLLQSSAQMFWNGHVPWAQPYWTSTKCERIAGLYGRVLWIDPHVHVTQIFPLLYRQFRIFRLDTLACLLFVHVSEPKLLPWIILQLQVQLLKLLLAQHPAPHRLE